MQLYNKYSYAGNSGEVNYSRAQKKSNFRKETKQTETWDDPFKNVDHRKDGAQIIGEPIIINSRNLYTPTSLKIRDLPHPINSKSIQRTNFAATQEDLEYMQNVPKFIISFKKERFDSTFSDKNIGSTTKCYARTVYYLIRPDTPSHLPLTYRMSVSQNINNPEDWSICFYAMAGGKEKGLMFLKRLDHDPGSCHKEGTAYIPTPHMHSAAPCDEKVSRPERPSPEFIYEHADMDLEQGINYILHTCNILPYNVAQSSDDDIRTIAKQLKRKEIEIDRPVDMLKDLSEAVEITAEYYQHLFPNIKKVTPISFISEQLPDIYAITATTASQMPNIYLSEYVSDPPPELSEAAFNSDIPAFFQHM
ncbi:MAG: hypothetical protein LBN07_04085 [Christensenellaceae bacterium]|jgi:hypothetical protein|nr:hypothetical protein [Christensenellaceae bacterium]